jgi:hypothetical protein
VIGNQDIGDAYREARANDHAIFADAPEIELGPTGREWSMITLVDLQTAVAFHKSSASPTT